MSCSFDPADVNSPVTSAAHPRTKMTRPMAIRRRGSGWVSGSASARAATGAIRVARRAGSEAAMTVTIVPTSTAMMKVRGTKVTPPVDAEPKTDSRARAIRMPTKKPRIDATKPVTAASVSTDVITWARVAPSARNKANSRVRCATRMLKVLMMRKLPTNSEMKAKTSSGVPMNVLMVELGALLRRRRRLLTGLCHGIAGQCSGETLAQHHVGDAALRAHQDAVVLVLPFEDAVGGGFREQRDGRTGQVVRGSVTRDTGDREVLFDASEKHDRQGLTDDQVVFRRGACIDDHVGGPLRGRALAEVVRRYVGVGDPVGAEGRWPVATDRLPVVADEGGAFPEDVAHRILDAVDTPHRRQQRRRDRMILSATDAAGVTGDRASVDRHRDTGVRRREDAREGRVDGVGEDEGARDERHAEDDRNRGQRQPELVREQASQADAEHASAPREAVSHQGGA